MTLRQQFRLALSRTTPLKAYTGMRDAAGRHDTANQRAAKIRSAEKRRCPECQRKAAMVKTPESYEIRAYCRWCGYQRPRLSA